MLTAERSRLEKRMGLYCGHDAFYRFLLGCFLTLSIIHLSNFSAPCAQTRDQCDKCCRDAGFDDYYLEQCKLKCFRSSDHCIDQKSTRVPDSVPQSGPQAVTPQRVIPPTEDASPPPPSATLEQGTPPSRAPKPPKREITFRWPEALNMVPGKEWEVAGQILGANGMPPQHPNYPLALRAVEGVLVDFARKNPTGGEMPTDQLERILLQFR